MSSLKEAIAKVFPEQLAIKEQRKSQLKLELSPVPMHRLLTPGTELTIIAYRIIEGKLDDKILVKKGQQPNFWIDVSAKMHRRLCNLLEQARIENEKAGKKVYDQYLLFLGARFVCVKVKGELTWILREAIKH
jgi:hypothetical protein